MHFLVIEDERALCETIVRSLRRLAYSVDCCYDGEKALELLGVERYDLVLLDLNLPGIDGLEILRQFRTFNTNTPVLILPQEYRFRIRWKVWIWEPMITSPSHFISRSWKPASAASPAVNLSRRMSA